ncbi:hypothetical protein O9992_29665 [Vibrio lentus]|nr:hypothetical protein [Vibrio lentus]
MQRSFKTPGAYSPLDAMKSHLLYGSSFSSARCLKFQRKNAVQPIYKVLKIPSYLPFTKEREAECIVDEDLTRKKIAHHFMNGLLTLLAVFQCRRYNASKKRKILSFGEYIRTQKNKWNSFIELPVAIFIHGVTAERGTFFNGCGNIRKKAMPWLRSICHITVSGLRYDSSPEHVKLVLEQTKPFS